MHAAPCLSFSRPQQVPNILLGPFSLTTHAKCDVLPWPWKRQNDSPAKAILHMNGESQRARPYLEHSGFPKRANGFVIKLHSGLTNPTERKNGH